MLVTLEGIDGSGKSTLGERLAKALRTEGVRVKRTEEPQANWLGEAVRRGIREGVDPLGLAFLFMADRADHVRRVAEWQDQGYLVLSDRYADSTIAYQAVALAERMDNAVGWLKEAQWRFFPKPDATIWLRLDPAVALERIRDRSRHDRFEKADFLSRVHANYEALAKDEPSRWIVVDASKKAPDVAAAAAEALLERLPRDAA